MRATETGVEWACWALLLLAAGWAGAGAWDAVANGAQPRVFWSPLANASRACPAYGALGADGAVRCVEVCPEGPPLGRFCPAHGALARSWLGAWALEDDALGAAAAQLLHGAVVGVGVALGFNAVLAACAPLVIFGAGYGAAGALGLLGATLLADADPDAPASRRFAAWACLGAAALGAAVLAALHGALTAAASVVQRAAGGGAGCVATAAIVVPLCAAAQVAALAGGLYAAAAVLAADATVTPVPWTLVGREVRLGDRAAGDRAAAALAVGLWGAALARHAALLAFAAPAARARRARGARRAAGPRRGRRVARGHRGRRRRRVVRPRRRALTRRGAPRPCAPRGAAPRARCCACASAWPRRAPRRCTSLFPWSTRPSRCSASARGAGPAASARSRRATPCSSRSRRRPCG